ncbi:MAG: DUF3429 domain-containing protein [Pseudomonadota bacterium]
MQRSLGQSPDRMPLAALLLGILGLIPFIALPFLAIAQPELAIPNWLGAHLTIPALLLYAAIILSFLGGVQWGLAMATPASERIVLWRRYVVSVLPSLLAWFALFLGTRTGLFVLAVGFVLLLIYDIQSVRRGEAPLWYERLRLGLSTVVVLSISITLSFAL